MPILHPQKMFILYTILHNSGIYVHKDNVFTLCISLSPKPDTLNQTGRILLVCWSPFEVLFSWYMCIMQSSGLCIPANSLPVSVSFTENNYKLLSVRSYLCPADILESNTPQLSFYSASDSIYNCIAGDMVSCAKKHNKSNATTSFFTPLILSDKRKLPQGTGDRTQTQLNAFWVTQNALMAVYSTATVMPS